MFAIALTVQRLLNLALLPIYARFLSPTAYGQLSVVVAIAMIVSLGLSFGMDTGTVRAWYQLEGDPPFRAKWVSTVAAFMTAVPIGFCAVASAMVLALWSRPFGLPAGWFALALMGAGLSVTATTVPLALLRAQQRLRAFLILTCSVAVINTVLSLLFLAGFHWGVAGWLAGTLLSYLFGLAVAIPTVPWRPALRRADFDARALRQALRFGVPLVPHLLSHWVLSVADRTILLGIVSGAALGQYTLGVNLTMPIVVLSTALLQSTMPAFARVGASGSNGPDLVRLTARCAGLTAVTGLAAATLVPVIIANLLPVGYHGAARLCVWLALGYSLAGLYQIPVSLITLVVGKTAWIWPITALAGATDIALVLLWCPTGGVMAAAIATAIAYGLLFLGFLLLGLRLAERRHFGFRAAGISCGLCLIAGYTSSLLSDESVPGIVGRVALLLATAWAVAHTQGLRARHLWPLKRRSAA